MAQTSHNVETLISTLGGKGKFQLTIHLLAAFTYAPLVLNHVIMAFHGSPIPHKCMAGSDILIGPNLTHLTNSTSVASQRYVTNVTHAKCFTTVYYSDGDKKNIECSAGQWAYFPKYGERNIVSQFDLVCSDKYLTSLATTIYFMGVMVGGLLFGDLADRFGRLPVMLFTLYGSMVVGLITAFSVSYTMFVSLRFFHGILIQGLQTSAYTLIMELFQPKDRPFAGTVTEMFFGASIILLAGLAYSMRYWRHLQIAASLVTLFTLFYPWVVPESLRWLVMKGKIKSVEKQLHRICKTNQIPYPSECWAAVKQSTAGQLQVAKHYNLTHLFRSWSRIKLSLICFYLWFVMSVSYYGLTFKITSFKGNPYLNFFISGLVETLTFAMSLPVMNRYGRKKPLLTCFVFAAAMCLASGFIITFFADRSHLITGSALAGKCAMACVFAVFFVYASEVYPTVIRNIGIGAGMFFARLGSVMAPQINQWTNVLFGIDGIYIFGVLSLVAGVLVVPLPETHRKPLPDTVDDGPEERKGVEENDKCNGSSTEELEMNKASSLLLESTAPESV